MSTPTPLVHLGGAVADMSPAAILRYGEADRHVIAEARSEAALAAHEEVERQELKLAAVRRAASLADDAVRVSDAIVGSTEDRLHGRRPGDVIVRVATRSEYLVLGVQYGYDEVVPLYLVVPFSEAQARTGDGTPAEWVDADRFIRP